MSINSQIEKLLYEEEGSALDFKVENYKFYKKDFKTTIKKDIENEKCELLKDILAFSNAWRREDAYILIGVKAVQGGRSEVLGINDDFDDAQLQQFINQKTQRPIEFVYRNVLIDGVKIGVINIPVQTRPFYLKNNYGKLEKNLVYIRRGSSTDIASPEEIRDMGKSEINEATEIPKLNFEFADLHKKLSLGTELDLETTVLDIPSMEDIPDYYKKTEIPGNNLSRYSFISSINQSLTNSSYYRELVNYHYILRKTKGLAFLLKNESNTVVLDIRAEIVIEKIENKFNFYASYNLPKFPKKENDLHFLNPPIFPKNNTHTIKRVIEITELDDKYVIEVPFEKVQPKQTVFCPNTIQLDTNESFSIEAKVTIYADNIPIPIKQALNITCNVIKEDGSLEHIEKLHYSRST